MTGLHFVVICSFLFSPCVYIQAQYASIVRDLEKIIEQHDFHGSIMISSKDKVLFHKAYGLSDRKQKIPNKINTQYTYASMGKMFTGVAILQLVEEGRLKLHDKVIDLWPDYPNKEIGGQITVHQLLTHTSGITGLFQMRSDSYLSDLKDYLPLFVDEELAHRPGTRMSYSNAGYILLGLIIEKISGINYSQYLEEKIFRPAGIKTAGLLLSKASVELAINYTKWRDMGRDSAELVEYGHDGNSAGGGYARVQDFNRFARALLDGNLLSSESLKILTSGYSDGRGRGKYGYGFFVNDIAGIRMYGHGGGGPGVNGELLIFEEEDLIISILSNTDPHTATFIKDAFTGLLLNDLGLLNNTASTGAIKFELEGYESAKFVTVQGAFTEGNMFKFPMIRKGSKWITEIDLPSGRHLYRFIVDGSSIPDPLNTNEHRLPGGLIVSEILVE